MLIKSENIGIIIQLEKYPYVYYLKDSITGISIDTFGTQSPFANCQVWTIGSMETIMEEENILDLIKALWIKCNRKNKLMINVYTKHDARVKELFGEENIVFKQEYNNTDSKVMNMYMINTGNLWKQP